MQNSLDQEYMALALSEAAKAAAKDETPVGAIIVSQGKIVGRGHNLRESGKDATLHAEMIAIREACRNLGGWRLPGATIYVTLEPCPMCAGAMVQARIERLVYGASDPKSGAAGSVIDLVRLDKLNHQMEVSSGVMAEEASSLLRDFFAAKRKKNQQS